MGPEWKNSTIRWGLSPDHQRLKNRLSPDHQRLKNRTRSRCGVDDEREDAGIDENPSIEEDAGLSATASRFIRRMLSREFIIVVLSLVAISTGELSTEQVIGVAIAGSSLALGRSVAKAKTGGSDG